MSLVKCNRNSLILVPDEKKVNIKDQINCPISCPYKDKICKDNSKFSVLAILPFDINTYSGKKYNEYSNDEISEYFNINKSNLSNENIVSKENNETDRLNSFKNINDNSKEGTTNKFNSLFGGNTNKNEDEIYLKSRYTQEVIRIGGLLYSNKLEYRPNGSLNEAINIIFKTWDYYAVFKNTKIADELKDDFIWLMINTSKNKIKTDDIDRIIKNQKYSPAQKFYYIFYDVYYKYNEPYGFFWSDSPTNILLTPKFIGKDGFIKLYCDNSSKGAIFRSFYLKNKNEILHYLKVKDVDQLFSEMTTTIAKNTGRIVLIDSYNDYEPIDLGTVVGFVKNMYYLTTIDNMNLMITFLKKYEILNDYSIVDRTESNFELSLRGNIIEDDSLYLAAKLNNPSNYATEYDDYVSLIKEYTKVFDPDEITIGELSLTKSNYSKIIEEVINEFMSDYSSNITNGPSKGKAFLVKSLYERKILSNFRCENDSFIKEILTLVTNPDIKKYHKLFNDVKVTSTNGSRTRISVLDYIKEKLDNDPYTIANIFENDEVIRTYFENHNANFIEKENEIKKQISIYNDAFLKFIED